MRLVPRSLKTAQQAQRRRDAFTLMEILVVVAIIVVLAGGATFYVFRYLEDAKFNTAKTSCKTLATAAKSFVINHPNDQLSDLSQLLSPPDGRSRYIDDPGMLETPWGGKYQVAVTEGSGGEPEVEVFAIGPANRRVSSIKQNNTQ